MKCLTVQQPWASLLLGVAPVAGPDLVPGVKDVENRTWSTTHRGNLLIHAGRSWDRGAMERYYDGIPDDRFPRGVVMGMVRVDEMIAPGRDACSPWQDIRQWKWRVSRPRVLARYVALRGAQGIFSVDAPEILQMARAAEGSSTTWWDGLSAADREWFVERCGILEYEQGFSRLAAVHEAYARFVAWKHSERNEHDGREEQRNDEVPYFGVSESWWHRWDRAHAD